MGKGTRNRIVRADGQYASTAAVRNDKKSKQEKSVIIGTWALGIFAILLVAFLLFNSLAGAGVFMRARTAAETDDFEINGAMMSYYIHTTYSDYIKYYEELYSSLLSSSSSLSVYSILGIDPNSSLKNQYTNGTNGETWFDFFASSAKSQVEEILLYCQAAKIAGVSLDETELASIDSQIQILNIYGQLYGYTFNSYLNTLYGRGVREKDVRAAMELQSLATKFATQLQEGYLDEATEDAVQAFFDKEENRKEHKYTSADYIAYTFSAEKDTSSTAPDTADTDYQTAKDEIIAAAAELLALTSKEDFNNFIRDRWIKENEETYKTKYYSDYLKEAEKTAEGATDEEKKANAEAEANKKLEEKLAEDADAYVENRLTEEYAYNTSATEGNATKLRDWVYGKGDTAAALVNTTYQLDSTTTNSSDVETAHSITVYLLVRAASKVEDTTRTYSYMVMTKSDKEGSKFDKTNAEAAFKLFKEGEKQDKEALEKLAGNETYTAAGAGFATLEDSKEGYFDYDELNEWLYAEERAAGDYELIECSDDDATYYLIVVVDEIGVEEWFVDARDGLIESQMETWLEEAALTYTVNFNEKAINKVGM